MNLENVKVGDMVRPVKDIHNVTANKSYLVKEVTDDNVAWVDDDVGFHYPLLKFEYIMTHNISSNDTVRLKSGEPFSTGLYTAEVDSVRDDIVLLKIGSWLQADALEKVEAKPQKYKVGDKFDYTYGDPWTGLTVEKISVDSCGDVAYHATNSAGCEGAFSESMMVPASTTTEPATSPLTVTLNVDTTNFTRELADQFQRIADALRAA